ncbi:PorV/PorQ family protein [Natronogracilivirga saccharolytica]|uniref:PorV/PorQ family protein n=1 Tax=Natronogracilivirga saccharolytica TaxID=2812953 RepID=A0A8J7SBC8_9BACT|nr:PorV/PorQ family protein [Natronogracilivirga saccharolytica]
MKRKQLFISSVLLLLCCLLVSDTIAQEREKRAQTTMKFLSVSTNARASGMGTAMTSVEANSAYSMLYNPASLSRLPQNVDMSFGMVNWIDGIDYNMGAVAYRPGDGRYGVFGLNFVMVDYGDIDETIVGPGEKGYYRLGTFRPHAYTVGFSYSRALTGRFSVGGNLKYIAMDLGSATRSLTSGGGLVRDDFREETIGFDFGVLYLTGFESLKLGMSVRNFSSDVSFNETDSELPLTFRIGVSMDVMDLFDVDRDMHSFLVSIDANRPRDFDEQLILGGEYTFLQRVAVRAGYGYPTDTQQISAGFGIRQPIGSINLAIDYSYTNFDVFSNVNTFSVQFGF